MYRNGWGIEKDKDKSQFDFEKALPLLLRTNDNP